jgi:virginiamycin B lyase
MSKRSLFWTAVALASILSACRGGVSTVPTTAGFAPASDASSADDAASARKAITITVIAPLPTKANGFSGSIFPQGLRTGAIAEFSINVGPKGRCVTSKSGERSCSKKIHVLGGGPYDLVVELHKKFPVAPHARALASASIAIKVKGKRAQEISFATEGALAKTKIALSEKSIHSFDPTSFFATVWGLDGSGNVLVVKSFADANGHAKTVLLGSTLHHALTFTPHEFKGSSADDAVVAYRPSVAPASVIAGGAKVEVTAKIKHGSKTDDGKAKLHVLKPKVTIATIKTSGSQPASITLGPDGALWFCEFGAAKVGRITTGMQITAEYPGLLHPSTITSAAGALWVAEWDGAGNVDRIATNGTITRYALPINSYPNALSAGPTGQLWFGSTQNNYVNTISSSGVFGTPHPLAAASSNPIFSTLGPDGNQYFTLWGTNQILKIAQTGVTLGLYNEPGTNRSPENIISGPDGQLWFTDVKQSVIYSMTTGGVFKAFPIANTLGIGGPLAFGPDGKLWFATLSGVGRLNVAAGTVISLPLVTGGGGFGIALGPDGAFYVTQFATGQIARLQ